jgi:NAD(P)-dependent dehydrogenase (short-subunit alcohol dehydrogenase family)
VDRFTGKTAFITGAASGIGLSIARRLARAGTSVAIADINGTMLAAAEKDLCEHGVEVLPFVVDVGDRGAFYRCADQVCASFGRLDFLINNAGVAYNAKPLHETPDAMIDWSININVLGVINGIKAFVPRMIAFGNGGHIVNTSSIGGFQVRKNPLWHQGLYAATKYAVTALSEGLRLDLEEHGIGVSILAPAAVLTNIGSSDSNRPGRFGGPTEGAQSPKVAEMLKDWGLPPDAIAERVLRAIEHDEPYVFTHIEGLQLLRDRHRRIEAAFDAIPDLHRS